MSRGSFPTFPNRQGGLRYSRLHFPDHHEVRHRYQKRLVRQHRHVRRHDHVPRHCRENDQGAHCPCTLNNEDQGRRTPRKKILRMDWWFYSCLSVYFPTDVDFESRVRRIWSFHRPQKMLLNTSKMWIFARWMSNVNINFMT